MEHRTKKRSDFGNVEDAGRTELLSALHFLSLSSHHAISWLQCIMQVHTYQYSQLDLGCSVPACVDVEFSTKHLRACQPFADAAC